MATDSPAWVKLLLRTLLKLSWSRGTPRIATAPPLDGDVIADLIPHLEPGDALLLGSAASLSHIAVYTGGGRILHSVATEKTMRGFSGSFWDALFRPFRWLFGEQELTGVIDEGLVEFVERFERHSVIGLRWEGLPLEARLAAIGHARTLVGKPYDYDFTVGDDEYYCTEIVMEVFERAAGRPPTVEGRPLKIPFLLETLVVEPISLLSSPDLRPVVANAAAKALESEALADCRLI